MDVKKIASIIFIVLGLLFITIPVIDFIVKNIETDNYIKATCKIVKLERIKKIKGPDEIILKYEYKINGIVYQSSFFSNGVGNIEDFEKEYPERKIFPVYYDPNNSHISVLVLGGRKYFVNAPIIVGVILIILGTIGLLSFRYKIFKEIWDTFSG